MKSVLIATDFSEEAEWARHRAASVADETGLGGVIAHVLPTSIPTDMHMQATSQAQQTLNLMTQTMAQEGYRFEPRLASGEISNELVNIARAHDLIVAGARGEDVLLDFGLGRTSTRLVRRSERPVLIVKRPAESPYRRVLVAVDFDDTSFAAAAFAMQIAPNADFTLMHAYEVEFESRLRRAGLSGDRLRYYREEAHGIAKTNIESFADRLASPKPLNRILEHGYPPLVVLEAAERQKAELIVLGKHATGVIEQVILGSVAMRVLELAKCDVLVVPELVA